jgi:capsular exopolysaccharide synthesis family protein
MSLPLDMNTPTPLDVVATARVAPEAAVPAALSAPPSVETLWHALRRRWLLVLGLGLLAAGAAAAVASLLVPAGYNVQALLHLGGRPGNTLLDGSDEAANFQRTQAALFVSYPVLHAALEQPEVAGLPEVRAHADPYEWLGRLIKTDVLLGPEVLRATFVGDDGESAARILGAVTRAYIKEVAARDEGKVRERVLQLQANYKKQSDALRDRRQQLLARLDELGLDDPETVKVKSEAALRTLEVLQQQKIKIDLDRKEAQIELAALRNRLANPASIVVTDFAILEDLKGDAFIAKAQLRLAELDEAVEKVRRVSAVGVSEGTLRANEAERRAVQDRITAHVQGLRPALEAKVRSKLIEEMKDNAGRLEQKLRFLDAQERSVDGEMQKKNDQLRNLRRSNRSLDEATNGVDALRDEVAALEKVLTAVGNDLAALQAQLPVPPRVTVLETPKAPLAMKRDRQLKYAAGAAVGAFLLVSMGLATWEFRGRRVYTSDDVAHGLGLDLLGSVPAVPPQARPVLPAGTATSQAALVEAVDGVRTRVLHAARSRSLKVIMVASAGQGEGKTSLSAHLAASLARGRRRTLLIDADLRHPAAHLQFNLARGPGFAEGLRGEADWDELPQPTGVAGLSLLSAGSADRRAIDALSEEGLKGVMAHFRQKFDFVVIDSCPVLPVADSLLVGQHVDAVIFSVLRNVSRTPAVFAAQQRLAALDIPTLGVVVVGEPAETYGVTRYLEQE